jgi:hypothetical protein
VVYDNSVMFVVGRLNCLNQSPNYGGRTPDIIGLDQQDAVKQAFSRGLCEIYPNNRRTYPCF